MTDLNNNRVQKWGAGATIGTTVAGTGIGGTDSSHLNLPQSVCVDGSGNIYVSDWANNRVQKWAAGATSGTTVAGQSNGAGGYDASHLSVPWGVSVDGSGNIYVVDRGNNRVQKFAPNTDMTYTPASAASYTAVVTSFGGASATTGADVVSANVTPSVSIASNVGSTITAGTSVTFTATPTNGGTSPTYQWYNNTTAIATGSTYSTTSLNNNDSISCVMSNSSACLSPATATSGYIRMTVNALPIVSIPATGCAGNAITLTSSLNPSQIVWKQGASTVQTTNASWAANGTTVAGQSSGASGTDASHLNNPSGLFVDGSGNIYVSDQVNNRVQQWAPGATSGTTVAGQSSGASGTDASHLSSTFGLYVDGSGNIYVVDANNVRVQKWAPGATTGTTVAGGNGTGAGANQFNSPFDVCVDGTGNVYVADRLNNRIQEWAPGATSGTTVAGGNGAGAGANQLSSPGGVFVDGSGNIYVGDAGNNRVQKWAPGATSGTTVAGGNGSGTGANQLSNAFGVHVDGAGNVYVADFGNSRIQQWAAGATSGTTVAGTGTSGTGANQLNFPFSVFVDDSGNIYAADASNNRIQKFAPNTNMSYTPGSAGSYTAVATSFGGASATMGADVVSSTVTPAISIASNVGSTITAGTSVTFTATPSNGGAGPSYQWYKNTTTIATGSTYTTSTLNNNDSITCVMTSNAACASPTTATGYIRMTVNALPVVSLPATGCTGSAITLSSSLNPSQIVWKQGASTVQTTDASWAANGTTVAGQSNSTAGSAANQFNSPFGVHVDGSGNIYVADYNNHRIQKWAPGATSGTTVAGGNGAGAAANQLNYPLGVYVDGSGNIYVADNSNNRIQQWAPGASSGSTVAGQSNGTGGIAANQLYYPTGVYVDGSGNIYVADEGNNRIQKWTPGASSGSTVAGGNGSGAAASQLSGPTGVYVDGIGNIYVTDYNNNRIQKWAPGASSGITVAGGNGAGSAANQLHSPIGVYVDGSGNIYVADNSNNRIQEFSPNTNMSYTPGSAGSYTAVATSFGGASATTGADVVSVCNVAPVFTLSSPQVIGDCQNSNAQINFLLNVNDADLGQTETWSQAAGGAPHHGSLQFTNAVASSGGANIATTGNIVYVPTSGYTGNDTFTVQVSDGIASSTMQINAVVNPLPTITLGANPSACSGATSALLPYRATTQSPTLYSVVWDAGALSANFVNATNVAFPASSPISVTIPASAGANTYTGTIYVSNSGGCQSTGNSFSVTVNANPTITLGTNPSVCNGITSANLSYTASSGSPDKYSIAWSTGAANVGFSDVNLATLSASPIVISNPTNTVSGTFSGNLTVKNSSTGCSSGTNAMSVTVISSPTVSAFGANPHVNQGATMAYITYNASVNGASTYGIAYDATAHNAGFTDVTNVTLSGGVVPLVLPGGTVYGSFNGTLTFSSNNGCFSSSSLPITITIGQAPSVTFPSGIWGESIGAIVTSGTTSATINYAASGNTPSTYSIVFNSAATSAGFVNVTDATLGASSITINIPANAPIGSYSGAMSVKTGTNVSRLYAVIIRIVN